VREDIAQADDPGDVGNALRDFGSALRSLFNASPMISSWRSTADLRSSSAA